jgi:hypothetical protein
MVRRGSRGDDPDGDIPSASQLDGFQVRLAHRAAKLCAAFQE